MKKVMSVVMGTIFVAGLSLTAASAFAGSACCASKEKASAEATSGACTTKSSMASMLKSAPGTTMKYERVDGGVVLVVNASSKEYVSVVQKAMLAGVDEMKMKTGATCEAGASAMKVSDGATCATKSAASCTGKTTKASDGAMKVSDSGSCTATKASAEVTKASASAHCVPGAGADKASMAAADCPDWMKVLCGANCTVENTANGVKIKWTTSEKNMVEQVQAAGEKLHADLSL